MPFKSEKQRRFLHANEPAVAKKWEKETSTKGKRYAIAINLWDKKPSMDEMVEEI